jgi:DnaK suppressor protein
LRPSTQRWNASRLCSYGECTDCGADIGTARLHVAPEAARCLGCQEKAEK